MNQKITQFRRTAIAGAATLLLAAISPAAQAITFSGTVYNDRNGQTNSLIDGTAINTLAVTSGSPLTLYVYLVNNSTSVIVDKDTLGGTPAGAWSLVGSAYTTYGIVLSTVNVPENSTSDPTVGLPANWVYTAEGNTGLGDGTPNGHVAIGASTSTSLSGINFGLNRRPNGFDFTIGTPTYSTGVGIMDIPAAALTGGDPEEGTYTAGMSGRRVDLYEGFGGVLKYNGVAVTTAVGGTATTITGFNISLLKLHVTAGASVVGFSFSLRDSANTGELVPNTVVKTFPLASAEIMNLLGSWKSSTAAQISWTTTRQTGTKYFEVQRSTDGRSYTTIGYVDSKAKEIASTEMINYTFVDETAGEVRAPRIMYRLLEVDLMDRESPTHSTVLTRPGVAAGSATVQPNPVAATLEVTLPSDAPATVLMISTAGQVVSQAANVRYSTQIDVSRFAPGLYFVQVLSADGLKETHRVQVQR